MVRKRGCADPNRRVRRVIAAASAITLVSQNLAWAVCADGTAFPFGGFTDTSPQVAHWSPGLFTGTAGSVFVPDNSVFENNDPLQPVTGGGHNWAFDQGTAACKETDTGPAGGTPTAWSIPPNNTTTCLLLPTVTGVTGNPPVPIFGAVTDIPFESDAITPTCNPANLSTVQLFDPVTGLPIPGTGPNPNNTFANQLGCSISHGAATTPQTATTFLFVTGLKSGLFSVQLTNVANPVVGGPAGKVISSPPNYYANIPLGQGLTNAAVSRDGMFAIATSSRRSPTVFACLNPLGDPGDPSLPINANFSVPNANLVKCMSIGNNGLKTDLATAFGPDNQPYFGGQRAVDTFLPTPGGSSPAAWPQCIFLGFGFAPPVPTTLAGKLQAVFNANSANHCGSAFPNTAFTTAAILEGHAIISHGSYMYASVGPGGGVDQFKVTVNPALGTSVYRIRTYLSGSIPLITGLGVADDLKSLMVYTDPSAAGSANQEDILKLPLCEDLP
jgi:hypothetical protein